MKDTQIYNFKNSLFSISMIFSVIGVRLIDEYVLDMETWAGVILAVTATITLYKVIDSILIFDKQITKRTHLMLNIFTLTAIFFIFYTFNL